MVADLFATVGAASRVVDDIGRSLGESASMLWDTLWALIGGFAVAGAVQAFVPRSSMQRHLGDHRPASVARAAGYGFVSSSCSYAASAMAYSLFRRGADFLTALVFMVASTNLVVELGVVLAVLIGWQFVAAEMVGGVLMIVLLVAAGSLWLRRPGRASPARPSEAAVELVPGRQGSGEPALVGPASGDPPCDEAGAGGAAADGPGAGEEASWSRLRSLAGWSDAAGYTLGDLRMLRRELLVGFLVAGALAELVPTRWWGELFLRGHGTWTAVENAAIGPVVAFLSFVCSVGNVPLAAALWTGGISFGGVVAFVFADLVSFPLVMVYRKQYGTRTALRIAGVFWLVMSAAGLVTGYLFAALGLVPRHRASLLGAGSIRLGPTSALDLLAVALLAALLWLHRHRDRFGGGVGFGTDPVCGMQVRLEDAPASHGRGRERVVFCSAHCLERYLADPARFPTAVAALCRSDAGGGDREPAGAATPPRARPQWGGPGASGREVGCCGEEVAAEPVGCCGEPAAEGSDEPRREVAIDPVCGMTVEVASAAARRQVADGGVWFCSAACAARYDAASSKR